jgi:hypothetical protein
MYSARFFFSFDISTIAFLFKAADTLHCDMRDAALNPKYGRIELRCGTRPAIQMQTLSCLK